MRFGKVAAFWGKTLQLVGELHLLAAMHFARGGGHFIDWEIERSWCCANG
jgi:hypothetical protein